MRAVRAVTLSFSALFLAACSGASPVPQQEPPRPPAQVAAPQGDFSVPPAAASTKPLPGVEDVELDRREAALFSQLVSQLFAPCPSEAVSIRQCVEEARPCAACRPAAHLLAEKVQAGATSEQARELYSARFGADVLTIDPADSPSRGLATAPVTIIVWSDFECPHCRYAMPLLDRIFDKYTPRVRLVHKFYPLQQHAHARDAARAAIAAQIQGKYWEMERVLFKHQDEQGMADLDRYAQELGLDMNRFHADMQSPRTQKILERDHDDAERAGLDGTPHILVNGRRFDSRYFHVEPDLDAWVKLEIELTAAAKAVPR